MLKQNSSSSKDPKKYVFGCICGKYYTSYAAVYTHIKNKHKSQKAQYTKKIIRPQYESNRKGRPKKPKLGFINEQIKQVNLFEFGLLNLCQIMQKEYSDSSSKKQKVLLTGNQNINFDTIRNLYDRLSSSYAPLTFNLLEQNSSLKEFYFKFIKHLSAELAAKILWSLNYLWSKSFQPNKPIEYIWKLLNDPILMNVWGQYHQAMKIVLDTLQQYLEIIKGYQIKDNEKIIDEILNVKEQVSSDLCSMIFSAF